MDVIVGMLSLVPETGAGVLEAVLVPAALLLMAQLVEHRRPRQVR